MGVFKRENMWWIDYYHEGKRIRESVSPNKTVALKALEARKGEIAQDRFDLTKVKPAPKFEVLSEQGGGPQCQDHFFPNLRCIQSV